MAPSACTRPYADHFNWHSSLSCWTAGVFGLDFIQVCVCSVRVCVCVRVCRCIKVSCAHVWNTTKHCSVLRVVLYISAITIKKGRRRTCVCVCLCVCVCACMIKDTEWLIFNSRPSVFSLGFWTTAHLCPLTWLLPSVSQSSVAHTHITVRYRVFVLLLKILNKK